MNKALLVDIPLSWNNCDLQRNIFSRKLNCFANHNNKAAAAGNIHADRMNRADIVAGKNFAQTARVIHTLQFGTGNQQRVSGGITAEIAVGEGSTACRND